MLVELTIRDLALIDTADVELEPGLVVLTGSSGAGKSLLVGALEMLSGLAPRGGAATWVRRGADLARVEARFELEGEVAARLRRHLETAAPELVEDVQVEGDYQVVLGRTLRADGRTRAAIDHRAVPLRLLRSVAGLLFEIHGQNEHQKLLEPAEQRRLLDVFAGSDAALGKYREARAQWTSAREALDARRARLADANQRLDLLRFQLEELTAAELEVGERARLSEERALLRSSHDLARDLGGLVDALTEREGAALEALQRAAHVLERWGGSIERLATAAEDADAAVAHVEELARTLGDVLDDVRHDPEHLERIESRLAELERLERKYATDDEGLVAKRDALEAELEELDAGEAGLAELEQAHAAATTALEAAARALAKRRRAAFPKLTSEVVARLAELGLPGGAFELAVTPRQGERRFGPGGADDLEFLLSLNAGEAPGALRHVASGGEAARVLLALRTVLSQADRGRTLVFDEIDSGVGGRLGPEVARQLAALGQTHQVLCVSHLPAIAAAADLHLHVSKRVDKQRTKTTIVPLAPEQRVAEIADMIAGGAGQATAEAEAKRLLAAARA
ncbi:MAG: DNA repair protein RecN [Planctomycetota bacterium]